MKVPVVRIRAKIGVHEFDARGPEASVRNAYEMFLSSISEKTVKDKDESIAVDTKKEQQ
jgi:hypothetical protein